MTETNINALCSVEAVFDGVDIEVTVEFSAGGGTFKHDELTAESREKANQHPIPSITGLQSALDGKANSSHVHNISDVTGLQSALDGKSSVVEHNDLTGRDAADVHPKESITGLTILDSPEFADTQITPLSVEATYTPTVWTYLVGLFTTVPKSVKEHIVKIWERLGLLEDKYILKYVVPVDSAAIVLTTDKYGNTFNFTEGDELELTFAISAWANLGTNLARINIRFNNNSQSIYYNGNVVGIGEFVTGGTNYKSQRVKFNVTINNGDLIGFVSNQSVTSADSRVTETFNIHTIGLNASSIFSIKLSSASGTAIIPAGTVFLIKKL